MRHRRTRVRSAHAGNVRRGGRGARDAVRSNRVRSAGRAEPGQHLGRGHLQQVRGFGRGTAEVDPGPTEPALPWEAAPCRAPGETRRAGRDDRCAGTGAFPGNSDGLLGAATGPRPGGTRLGGRRSRGPSPWRVPGAAAAGCEVRQLRRGPPSPTRVTRTPHVRLRIRDRPRRGIVVNRPSPQPEGPHTRTNARRDGRPPSVTRRPVGRTGLSAIGTSIARGGWSRCRVVRVPLGPSRRHRSSCRGRT